MPSYNNKKIFGLTFSSDITVDNFLDSEHDPDFRIKKLKQTSKHNPTKIWSSLSLKNAVVNEKDFYSEITNGNEIRYFATSKINKNKLLAKIFHMPMSYLLFQRKNFVLHGSAFTWNEKAIALCGISGSGKSELVQLLSKKFNYLTDDIIGIDVNGDENLCEPGLPFICSINGFSNFSMDEKRGRSIAWVPIEKRELRRVKLDQIFFLDWGENFEIRKINEEEAFKMVIPNSFRPLPSGCNDDAESFYLESIAKIIRNTKMNLFIRKKGSIEDSANYIIKYLNDRE